jgi:tocopherol cyclase
MSNPLSAWLARRRAIWRPDMYHGHGLSRNFFEGWYFKFVDPTEQHVWAVIPGVFLQWHGDEAYAFVQTLNGSTGETHFHRYPLADFHASGTEFDVRIGPNHFRADGFTLDVDRAEQRLRLRGALRFDGVTPWPVTLTSPGIMNWYAFVPFMECYHGVVSLDHAVAGRLAIDGRDVDFSGGRGYIEKDWGQAFPKGWIWMQTNHFARPGTCLTASVARIPWLGTAFRGFIVGLWHAGQLHRFATYNGAQITALTLTDTHVHWTMQNERHTLALEAERSGGGLLHAPFRTAMVQRVLESLTATIAVRLCERTSGRVLFEDRGRHAGLEVGGEIAVVLDG